MSLSIRKGLLGRKENTAYFSVEEILGISEGHCQAYGAALTIH